MPILKLYPNGLTAGVRPSTLNVNGFSRGNCSGWSLDSSRSNTRFLYSVRAGELPSDRDGCLLLGFALSFTIRYCPESHSDWMSLREAFIKRLRRKGLYRLHWLTEWQKRGVPHLHAALWFDYGKAESFIQRNYPHFTIEVLSLLVTVDWIQLANPYCALAISQNIKPITDDLGWLQYLSKHASRGAAHYQRALGKIPVGWQKTGRMWGHVGDFPVSEPLGINLDNSGFYAFRRIVRGWRCANARSGKNPARRIRSARRMLQSSDPVLCRVRGVSEWIDLDLGLQVIEWLHTSGYQVESDLLISSSVQKISNAGFYAFRRIVRGWRCANARTGENPARRIRSARRMLQNPDFVLCRGRGVSEWIDLKLGLTILKWLRRDGYKVDSDLLISMFGLNLIFISFVPSKSTS